jgi:cyclophilin family peptidyl-prolyl cis-trans isomerase/HEAT repeat protein
MPRTALALLTAAALSLACPQAPNHDDRSFVRLAEIEDLRETGSAELNRFLASPNPKLRERAAVALARIQDPLSVPSLVRALDDSEPAVADAALFALGQLGLARGVVLPPAAAEAVIERLAHPRAEHLALAVEALGKLAPAGADEHLAPLATHPAAAVRAEVAMALFRLRFAPRWRGDADTEPAATALATTTLTTLLGDTDAAVRRSASHAFSRLPEASAGEALVGRIGDEDEWTRLFAIRALGRLAEAAPPSAAAAVATAAGDSSPAVRREAIATLGALGAAALAPVEAASDPSTHVRSALATALGRDTSPDTLEALRALEQVDSSREVRLAALAALAERLGAESTDLVAARLDHEDVMVRATAARALAQVEPGRREALARKAAADLARPVRVATLEAVGAEAFAADLLTAALATDDIAERGTAVDVLAGQKERADRDAELRAAFARSGGDDWVELREAIVDAMATDAVFLTEASKDPSPAVRSRAGAALRRLGSEPAAVASAPREASRFLTMAPAERPRVRFETERGTFVVEGLPELAPLHVASLLTLVESGFYDGLLIHRVVPNFVVQGGDPRGDGWGGPDFQLRDEVSRQRFERGMVGMAKAGKDTGGCQFFVTLVPTPHLDGNYTIYGRVLSGMEVVDQLEVGDTILRAVVEGDA